MGYLHVKVFVCNDLPEFFFGDESVVVSVELPEHPVSPGQVGAEEEVDHVQVGELVLHVNRSLSSYHLLGPLGLGQGSEF